MSRLRVLSLDALGTLVALEPPGPALRDELAARFGIDLEASEAENAIAAEIAYYRTHFDEARDAASLLALRIRCAEVLRTALPPSPQLRLVPTDALTNALLASLRFRAFPDAEGALRHARACGLRIVVASNWDVSLHGVLHQVGLAPLLHGAICSAEAGARKPAAQIFHRALALAGDDLSPAQAVHVGDNLREDVEGARGAGMQALLLARSPGGSARSLGGSARSLGGSARSLGGSARGDRAGVGVQYEAVGDLGTLGNWLAARL